MVSPSPGSVLSNTKLESAFCSASQISQINQYEHSEHGFQSLKELYTWKRLGHLFYIKSLIGWVLI